MASTVITTPTDSVVQLFSNDTLLVTKEATLYGDASDLVSVGLSQSSVDVFVLGSIVALNGRAFDFNGAGRHAVRIDASGSVQAAGTVLSFGISDFDTYVQNAGTLTGASGINVETSTSAIINSGTISAGFGSGFGVVGDGIVYGNGGTLSNSGTITGGLHGIRNFGSAGSVDIINSGLIHGEDQAIESNWGLELHNSGTVSALNVAILLFDGNGLIYNTGTILGDIEAVSSDEFAYYGTTGTVTGKVKGSVEGRNFLYGGDNRDEMEGGEVRDIIVGGGGDDVLRGFEDFDRISGGLGDDEIYGGDGADVLTGQDGDDTISGDAGDDKIYGGAGDDTLVDFAGGNDIMRGGTGDDILNSFAGDDDLRGGSGNDQLIAGVGQDDLFGEDGDDDLDGGFGMDTLRGGAGNDVLRFDAFDTLINGGSGEDTIIKTDDLWQDINFNGLQFKNVEHLEAEDVVLGEVNADDQSNVINIGAARILNTYGGADDVRAVLSTFTETNVSVQQGNLGGGDDTFYANGTVHSLNLGNGNDRAEVAGRSTIYGGSGDDWIEMFGANTIDQDFRGNDGNDFLSSLSGDDILRGGSGFDVLRANVGNDFLDGGTEDDQLYGERGNDTLFGGTGADLLNGGEGDDRLTGGEGRDTFVFTDTSEFDRVLDFEDGLDRINLRAFGFTDAADALNSFVQQGSNVRIIEGSAVMVISNAQLSDFTADDLLL